MKVCEELTNVDLLMYYHSLQNNIEYVLGEYIYDTLKLDLLSVTHIIRLFDNTISVNVECDDGNLYTFTLCEDLSVIETE